MKVKDVPELERKVLDILPIKQADLWKKLEINDRDCSELVSIMLKKGKIKKTRKDRTYLIEYPNGDGNIKTDTEAPVKNDVETPAEKGTEDISIKTELKDIPIRMRKNIHDLQQQVLDMLPIMQSEVWKKLDIDHRYGSKLISTMLKEKLIKKTKRGGTFLIEKMDGDSCIEADIEETEKVDTGSLVEIKIETDVVGIEIINTDISATENTEPEISTNTEKTEPDVSVDTEISTNIEKTEPDVSVDTEIDKEDISVDTEKTEPDVSVDTEIDKEDISVDTDNTEPDNTEPDNTEPDNTEPEFSTNIEKTEPDNTEPEFSTNIEKTEPDNTEPDNTEPEISTNIEKTEPDVSVDTEIDKEDISVDTETDTEDISVDNTEAMPTIVAERDISSLRHQVLSILPMMQSEIWKKLGIDRRSCSRLINDMIKYNLVKKTKQGGTYLIESLNGNGNKLVKDFSGLLSKSGNFTPCCGCEKECDPIKCLTLTEWVLC